MRTGSTSSGVKLIVTNDDGFDAPGIAALRSLCQSWGDVVVVAPDSPQSYMGHRVTTAAPIAVRQADDAEFHVGGTPADCARIALTCLAPGANWLVSGINLGGNLGVDVYCSGTVAAAREAALLGCPSIAISHYVGKGRTVNWAVAQRRAAPVLEQLLARGAPPRAFWNVNLPHPEDAEPHCEAVFCPLDYQPLDVRFTRDERGYYYAGNYHGRARRPGSDVDQCFQGKITITAIPLDFECNV